MPKTSVLFWDFKRGNDTAEHARYGVGPASDYATPTGTPIAAPFAGRLEPYWTREGGNSLRLIGSDFIFHGQHMSSVYRAGQYGHRDQLAVSGNTGTATSGPHVHAYIIVRATGRRISFYEWLRDYVWPQKSTPAAPAPAASGIVGKTFHPNPQAYWYNTDADAANLRNVKGNGNGRDKKYSNDPMLIGSYLVVGEGAGGSFQIKANDGSRPWVSGKLRHLIR